MSAAVLAALHTQAVPQLRTLCLVIDGGSGLLNPSPLQQVESNPSAGDPCGLRLSEGDEILFHSRSFYA